MNAGLCVWCADSLLTELTTASVSTHGSSRLCVCQCVSFHLSPSHIGLYGDYFVSIFSRSPTGQGLIFHRIGWEMPLHFPTVIISQQKPLEHSKYGHTSQPLVSSLDLDFHPFTKVFFFFVQQGNLILWINEQNMQNVLIKKPHCDLVDCKSMTPTLLFDSWC